MPLDEKALRKPGFQEGVKATLCDGQEWTFPPVKIRIVPKTDESGAVKAETRRSVPGHDCTKELNEFLDYEVDNDTFRFTDWLTKRFAVSAKLLLANYDLDGEQLAELLYWERDDEECEERWRTIDSAIMGIGPKASAAGLN